MEDRWFSVDEIANYLGVKRDTVYKWIVRKSMPAHKLGRLWKFRKSEIDEWVFANDEWGQSLSSSDEESAAHVLSCSSSSGS